MFLAVAILAVAAIIVSMDASRHANNLQDALDSINMVATGTLNGLMSAEDKRKLGLQQILNGGAIVYEATHKGTCSVVTSVSAGSGFLLSISNNKAIVVTAAHVILQNSGKTTNDTPSSRRSIVVASANGNDDTNVQVSCDIVGWDQAADIAILRTKTVAEDAGSGFNFTSEQKVLQWTDSDAALKGQDTYCIGDPLTEDFQSISGGTLRDNKYLPTARSGSIESIAFSCPIAPGNSGGPVLDSNGQVIGLSTFIFDGYESFGGGINSYMASRIVPRLMSGTNNKGYLGISDSTILGSSQLETLRQAYPAFKASNYDVIKGLVVLGTEAGAAVAGIQVNDIIVAINGTQIGPFSNQFSPTRVTWFVEPGNVVTVDTIRPSSASPITRTVTMSSFPSIRDIVFTTAF